MHKMTKKVETPSEGSPANGTRRKAQERHQEPAHTEPLGPDSLRADTSLDSVPPRLNPTRYGDWELKGRCIDF